MIADPLTPIVAGWLAFAVASAICKIAAATQFLPDRPNNRSSHVKVTSRAGGVAILSAWLAALLVLSAFWADGPQVIEGARLAVLTAGAFFLGIADDQWGLSPAIKFGGQLALALSFVFFFGGFESLPAPYWGEVDLGIVGLVLTVLWIVGFMNIFNFMDGANGLASGAAMVGMTAFAITIGLLGAHFYAVVAMMLAASLFGFFRNNFASGSIFMGDSGSLSVSFLIAALAVLAVDKTTTSIYFTPLIFMPLILDAAFTLCHRAARGRNVVKAHREHVYQLLLREGRSHREVAVIYCGLTGFAAVFALFMLTLEPAQKYIPVVGLVIGLLIWSMTVFRRATAKGTLS